MKSRSLESIKSQLMCDAPKATLKEEISPGSDMLAGSSVSGLSISGVRNWWQPRPSHFDPSKVRIGQLPESSRAHVNICGFAANACAAQSASRLLPRGVRPERTSVNNSQIDTIAASHSSYFVLTKWVSIRI